MRAIDQKSVPLESETPKCYIALGRWPQARAIEHLRVSDTLGKIFWSIALICIK